MKTIIENSIKLNVPGSPGLRNLFAEGSSVHGHIQTYGFKKLGDRKVVVHFSYTEDDVQKLHVSRIVLPEFTTVEQFKADVLTLLNAELV
jgi:hypothetical protein